MKNTEVPFGFEKEGKLYLSGWQDLPDREIGEVRDNDLEKSVSFFTDRFNDLETKVNELFEKINATENKGSFLMKLLHLKDQLKVHDGLGDYSKLHEEILKHESLVKDIIKKNRARNSEIKSALVEEAKEAVKAINWKEGTEQINDLKTRWIKTGNAEEEKNDLLEKEFWDLIQDFFERKKNFFEDKQKLIKLREQKYQDLVVEAGKVQDLSGGARVERIKALRDEWKSVGGVPNDVFKPLIQEFNKLLKSNSSEKTFDYSKILESLDDLKRSKGPVNKQELTRIKKNTHRDKSRNPDKGRVLELIQLLLERDFVNVLANKRFKDFPKLEADKKKNIRLGIVRDLISRDKTDLSTYEENSINFSSANGQVNKLVEGKLKSQRRKIEVKEKLIDWIKNDEF